MRLLRVTASLIMWVWLLPSGDSASAADNAAVETDSVTTRQFHEAEARLKAGAWERRLRIESETASEESAAQENYDVLWYDINIRVFHTEHAVSGKITFLAEAMVGGLNQVVVDLDSLVSVDSIVAESGALAYTRSGDLVTVSLHRAYAAGEVFRFDFYYEGENLSDPDMELGLMFSYIDSGPIVYNLSEPFFARKWWPCKDRPDDKADSLGIHIEVDSALYCVSNGTLDSIVQLPELHARVFHYTCHYPISTYLFSLAIAPYRVWNQSYIFNGGTDTLPIEHCVFPENYQRSLTTYGQTPEIMAILEQSYGPYPFSADKYGHANVGYPGGGMEHQTITSMSGSYQGFLMSVVVHEMAHQWWGDMVTCETWHDIWLNEGWATYSEAVYELDRLGWTYYHLYMNHLAYYGTGSVYRYGTSDFFTIFNVNLVYHKAAWVVHMLRGVVGEEKFAAGIQAYRSAFAYGCATTEDFKNVWEQATGAELDAFINQWLYGEQYPRYEYCYFQEPADGGYDFHLMVQQVQLSTPQTFEMPVDFYVATEAGTGDTLTLNVDERKKSFKLHFDHPVNDVELDPAGWILKSAFQKQWTLYLVTPGDDLPAATVGQPYFRMIEARAAAGPFEMSCIIGEMPPGLSLSADGLVSGTPTVPGDYAFDVQVRSPSYGWSDTRYYYMTVYPAPCCLGRVGNVNGMDGDEPTIGDVTLLIDMLFIRGNQPACMAEADINGSGGAHAAADDISIGDITMLIDYLFISGPQNLTLPNCPGDD